MTLTGAFGQSAGYAEQAAHPLRSPDAGCGCLWAGCGDGFAALAAEADAAVRAGLRDRLVECHLHLARAVAGRYRRYGLPFDDITQVAAVALVEAVDRFEPERGLPFSNFAVPTVAGAIKRYFRDHRWVLRTPRGLKELYLEVRTASESLTQRLGRCPAAAELAAHLGYDEKDVLEALRADDGRRPLSLDAPLAGVDGGEATLGTLLGGCDDSYERIEYRESLRPLLAALPVRELRAVTMRFFGNMTQAQIAEQMGCSQMHVSRLLRAAIARLRSGLVDDPTTGRSHVRQRRRRAA